MLTGIVLDWNFEPVTDRSIREANPMYLAAYLESTAVLMLGHHRIWTRAATAFVGDLKSGHLPTPRVCSLPKVKNMTRSLTTSQHPFLAQSRGRKTLHGAASFAAQMAVAASETSETLERDPRRLEVALPTESGCSVDGYGNP